MQPARTPLSATVCVAVGAATLAPLDAASAAPGASTAAPQAAPTVGGDSLDVVGWDDLAVGSARPRFSWVVDDADRDERQSAYQLEVTGPDGVTVKVTARGARQTGEVRIVVDGKVARTVELVRGKARTSTKVARGKHRVVVRYGGSRSVAPSAPHKQIVHGT